MIWSRDKREIREREERKKKIVREKERRRVSE